MGTNQARGWRRIGIVLSILWFVGFGFFIWSRTTSDAADFYGHQLRFCYAILDTDKNWPNYERCKDDAAKLFSFTFDQNVKGIPILIGVDLASVAIGWLLVWCVVAIVRWIRRGFASS
jgi:hypothetical protein